MKSGLIKIKELLLRDKRKTERLILGGKLWYSLSSFQEWIGPFHIGDVSGGGIRFKSEKSFKKNTEINVKISFSDGSEPLNVSVKVIWCRKVDSGKSLTAKRLPIDYKIGIKFFKMPGDDRRRFISYYSEKILSKYLDNEGNIE